jgi:hypothetical protein
LNGASQPFLFMIDSIDTKLQWPVCYHEAFRVSQYAQGLGAKLTQDALAVTIQSYRNQQSKLFIFLLLESEINMFFFAF